MILELVLVVATSSCSSSSAYLDRGTNELGDEDSL